MDLESTLKERFVRIAKLAGGRAKEKASLSKQIEFTICSSVEKAEKRIISGIVLQPEVVDGQGDIMSADVIAEAAYKYLSEYNRKTTLKLQHSSPVKKRFSLIESYIAPMDFVLGTTPIKTGTWIVSMRIFDDKIWKQIKDGKITGFSIGGKAKTVVSKPLASVG